MDWTGLFEKRILERGRNYFLSGAVRNLHRDKDRITAVVHGTEDYRVKIDLDDDEIDDMLCSCPYADGGLGCKHMAAVLFSVEAADDAAESLGEDTRLQELIAQIPEEKLRELLYQLALEDPSVFNRLRSGFDSEIGEEDLDSIKREFHRIFTRYTGRYGYIDYDQAYAFTNELMEDEQMYERLLKKDFPQQVRDFYIAYVKRQASISSDREMYRRLTFYLDKIKGYPEGPAIAHAIAEGWRAQYVRRKAMLDEMSKAGY